LRREFDLLRTARVGSLVFTSLAHFINDGGSYTIPLIISILATERIVSTFTIIMMPITFYSASLMLSMLLGALADRAERPGLMIGIGLGIISAGLFGLAISLSMGSGVNLTLFVLFATFVTGLGTAFYHPIGAAILQSVYENQGIGKALGINGAMGAFGRALYPSLFFLVASVVTANGSIAFLASVGGVASIVVSIGLRRSYRSPDWNDSRIRGGSIRRDITRPLVVLTLVAFVSAFSVQGVASWIPTYLALQKGFGISSSLGIALTGMYGASIIGQPLFGYLVDRFDKRLVLAGSTIGSALTIVGYLFASGALGIVWLVLLGFFTFSSFPLFLSLASDYVPRKSSSLSNALVWSLGVNGGGVVGPAVVGALALSGLLSWPDTFELMAAMALVAAAMVGLLRKPLKNAKMPSSDA